MSRVHLGIDVGGTASRWVACGEDGREIARGQASGATGHLFNSVEKERLRTAIAAIAEALSAAGHSARTVSAGLTGYGAQVRAEMEALLAGAFGVGAGDVVVTDDIVMAYLANYAPGAGHLISAGTGSIGVYVDGEQMVRVGGRGILIDDGGSGSWIALRALDLVYRAIDSDPAAAETVLARAMFAAIGGAQWTDVRQFVYGGDRGRIGVLATAVAKAAEQGDAMALEILRQAGVELARLAEALTTRVGARPVGVIGGVLKLHPVIESAVENALPDTVVSILSADVALQAAKLQLGADDGWRQVLRARTTVG